MVEDALPPRTHLATLEPAVTPDLESPYQILLNVRDRLAASNDTTDQRKLKHMDLKVLGFLLLDLWQSQSHRKLGPISVLKVSTDIKSAQNDATVFELGLYYRECLLRAFRLKGTSKPSKDPSLPSFDTIQDIIGDCLLNDNPTDYRHVEQLVRVDFLLILRCQLNYKPSCLALARDSLRCLASGMIDEEWAIKTQDLWNAAQVVGGLKLECCYILPRSTTQRLEGHDAEGIPERVSTFGVLAILKSFGLDDIVKIVEVGDIHYLCNFLTLNPQTHATFNSLNLWFDATDIPNQYKIFCAYPFHLVGCGIQRDKVVTFTANPALPSKSKKPISLPHPSLLALHATCCRVAHMSGAAEYFADVDRHMDDTLVLAEDGSSGVTLINALQRVVHMG